MPHKGACLCGQTTIELKSTHPAQVRIVCHCTDCRQTSGSAFSTNVLEPKKDVTITGPVKEYSIKAASGNTVTRVFCGNCGSAITHLTAAFGDAQAIQTGNFADFANIPITTELFVKDRWTGLAPIAGAAQAQTMS
ncbi:Mss4-like protein [Mycena leptocephala]|nr:Mss4-like protein [Mycena leptocephala]